MHWISYDTLINVNVDCSDNNHSCLFPDPCKIEIDTASDDFQCISFTLNKTNILNIQMDLEVPWHNAASDIK